MSQAWELYGPRAGNGRVTSSANTYPNKLFSQNFTHTYTQTASHQLALQMTLAFALTISVKRGLNVNI